MRCVPTAKYIFIIDTNEYAGNFERELTAYCTGIVGDCGVGDTLATQFKAEYHDRYTEFENIVSQQPDDHGALRPTSIMSTPPSNRHLNSVGIFFDKKPKPSQIKFIIQRAKKFSISPTYWRNGTLRDDWSETKPHFKILGYRFVQEKLVQTVIKTYSI